MTVAKLPAVGQTVVYSRPQSPVYRGTVLESPSSDPDDTVRCLLVRCDDGSIHHVNVERLRGVPRQG